MSVPNILMRGIVGSVAYGLDTEDSDVDKLGIFAQPTAEILGVYPPAQSVVTTFPDTTYHDAGKFASLALKCNPTLLELLWLPRDLYEVQTELGARLIKIRKSFLSAPYVRNAYLGYATQQFRRLENRGDGSFSADTRKRTAKHARHLLRLLTQGLDLYEEGTLNVRLSNPEWYREFGEKIASGDLEAGRKEISMAEHAFNAHASCLPEKPDVETVQDWLLDVRRAFW